MLLRDFRYLDWENKYYVIHAGDHIRLRRAIQDEHEKRSKAYFEWRRMGKPKNVEWISLDEWKARQKTQETYDFQGPTIVTL